MLKAGFGRMDITPPLGCVLQGYFHPRISEEVHDPLFASALVAENNGVKICIVSCDLIGINRPQTEEARKLINEKLGIPEDSIIICSTHTHTGPVMLPKIIPGWEKAVDEKWIALLPSKICSAALQADRMSGETGVSCASGVEEGVSFNRRFLMKDGSYKTNPGVGNPDIEKPAGPIDPEVGVLAFGEDCSDLAGLVLNFALHLDTVGGSRISADFPGVIRKLLGNTLGEGTGFLYTSGAMGNINHINVNRNPEKEYSCFEFPSRIGTVLAGETLKTVYRMESFDRDAPVGGARRAVRLQLKEYDEAALQSANEAVTGQDAALNKREYMAGIGLLRAASLGKGEITAEIAAVRIGDAAFVTIPGEYFVELGLFIKKNSHFKKTFIVELGLDCLGYIATKEAYEQWGYEPTSSPLAPGAGEILAGEAVELLGELK